MANEKEKILNTRIKLKIATYAEWTDESQALKGANFVLKRGEIGLCEIPAGNTEATTAPTVLFKVGDGTNAFKDLKWASALAADVYGWAKKSEDEFKEWAGTNIDTDTDTRYSFEKVDTKTDANYGKLKITAQRYNVKTSSNVGTAVVSYVDLVTPEELEEILKGYVKSVSGKEAIKSTGGQTPEISLALDNSGNVQFTQSDDGLKGNIDLSNFATKAEIPTDFGVLTVTGDQVVVANPTTGHVVLETKLDNSGNVKFEKTNAGLKGNVDLTHDHDGVYKPIQEVVEETGATNKTVTKVTQDANGVVDVTFADIAITESQITDLHKVAVAEGDYINVVTSSTTNSTSGAVTTTYTVSVDETALSSKIAADTTAAMEFKGATSSLPASANKGDMYKISSEFDVAAANDAQNNGFTAQVGDAIVYDGSKWYLIPSGDDIEDTWRPVQVDGDEIDRSATLNLIAGQTVVLTPTLSTTDDGKKFVAVEVAHDNVPCSSQINASPVDLTHGGSITVISSMTVNSQGHVEGYVEDHYTMPEQYVHPEANVTSTSTNVTLSHGDNFVVKNETFDETGHVKTETTTTYTLPAQYVHPNAANSASSNATTLAHGDSFDVVTESFDAQGHRISTHTETYTLPELPESIDTAVQTITSNCTAGQETSGLKVTRTENAVNVEIDDAVTFIFDCGGAE